MLLAYCRDGITMGLRRSYDGVTTGLGVFCDLLSPLARANPRGPVAALRHFRLVRAAYRGWQQEAALDYR